MNPLSLNFLSWCLAEQNHGLLRFQERLWSNNLRYYYCEINSPDGERCFGLGVDPDSKMAIVKAASEALERYMIRVLGIHNSNGCATHITQAEAQKSARLELIERDAFLCHFYAQKALKKVSVNHDFDQDLGLRLESFETYSNGLTVSLTLFRGQEFAPFSFGGIFGLGVSEDAQEAHQKSFIEAYRFIDSFLKADIYRPLTLEEFNKLDKITVHEHACLGMDHEYFNPLAENLFASHFTPGDLSLDSHLFTYRQADPQAYGLKDCPLFFTQCFHPQTQALHFGKFKDEHLNLERLQQFAGENVSLLKIPHFLA